MTVINKNSITPYYLQLKKIIYEEINNNRYTDGKLYSENYYSRKHNITVSTVRKALGEIKNEGKIRVEKGKGYFIQKPKIDFNLSKYLSMGRELKEKGIKQKIKVLRKEMVKTDGELSDIFKYKNKSKKLIRIERMRYIQLEPLVHENIYLDYDLFGPIFNRDCEFIIYDYITNKLNINFTRTEEYISPINLNKEESRKLNVKIGLASFLVTKVSYVRDRAVVLIKIIIRGDKCRFHSII